MKRLYLTAENKAFSRVLFFAVLFVSTQVFAAAETNEPFFYPNSIGSTLLKIRSQLDAAPGFNANVTAAGTSHTSIRYFATDIGGLAALLEVEETGMRGYRFASDNRQPWHVSDADVSINRAYFSYAGIFETAFIYGRQRLVLDNARFVGEDGGRRNEQTYDAVKVENTAFTDTKITLAYVDKVHGVFSAAAEQGDVPMHSPMINVQYKGSPVFDVSAYGYFLSFDNDPAASRRTSGIRVKGEYPLSGVDLLYAAEYATQSDYKDGVADVNADYRHLVAGIRFPAVAAEMGYEVLSGDGEYAFQTPLAAGHAFNGWADQFLVTPLQGLVDVYISANTSFAGVRWKAVYHDFSAQRGGINYGNELNLQVVKNFSKRYALGLKYASYFAEDFSGDTAKIQIYAQITI